jgi:hypothetical protein
VPGGAVLDVKFTEAALAKGPQALSATLLTTLREAVGEAARRQAVIVEENMGDDCGLVDQVLETQAVAFGTTVEELRSKLGEAPPTCGASLSAAAPVTEVKAAQTTAKTTQKVNKLRELLQKVLDRLRKLQQKFASTTLGKSLTKIAEENEGEVLLQKAAGDKGLIGKRWAKAFENPVLDAAGKVDYRKTMLKAGATEALKKGGEAAIKGVLGYNPADPGDNPAKTVNDHLGKLTSHVKNAKKASGYDGTGRDQSGGETREDLDF